MAATEVLPTKVDAPSEIGGIQLLTDKVLNAYIAAAPNRRKAMFFQTSTGKEIGFTLNPQTIVRNTKSVEVEFPTMAAWHTYRWMIEPPLWEIAGYSGFLGRDTLQNIVDLDGDDNCLWDFPYLGASRQVKIISTQVPLNANTPFSFYYKIIMRELAPVVRNFATSSLDVSRIAATLVSPSFDGSSVNSAYLDLTTEHDIAAVLQTIHAKFPTIKVPDSVQTNFILTRNSLKDLSWTDAPTNSDGKQLSRLIIETT